MNNNTQKRIKSNKALNSFRAAIENAYSEHPWKTNFDLMKFLNYEFKKQKRVMNNNKRGKLARLGSEAYPNQARRILLNLNDLNSIFNLPAFIIVAIAEGLNSSKNNREAKMKAFRDMHATYGNVYTIPQTKTILRTLMKNLNDNDLASLVRYMHSQIHMIDGHPVHGQVRDNQNIKYNNNIFNALNAQRAARARGRVRGLNAARGMVGRLRNRQVNALMPYLKERKLQEVRNLIRTLM